MQPRKKKKAEDQKKRWTKGNWKKLERVCGIISQGRKPKGRGNKHRSDRGPRSRKKRLEKRKTTRLLSRSIRFIGAVQVEPDDEFSFICFHLVSERETRFPAPFTGNAPRGPVPARAFLKHEAKLNSFRPITGYWEISFHAMLLRAFVCARNVRDGNDDGQVVEEEKFDVSGWAKSREKKIMRERGYFIYSKNSWNRERKFSWIFVN